MKHPIPRSPFSTRLSGSAKETELRIRSIFQWKKQRPPLPLMAAVALLILLCGNLVSCQSRPAEPELVMDVQYYDTYSNYIEIPALSLPAGQEAGEAVTAINQALASLKAEYQPILAGAAGDGYGQDNLCILYPCVTGRYLNLVFYQSPFGGVTEARILSFVYDKEADLQVSLSDALAMADLTEQALLDGLAAQIDPWYAQDPIYSSLHIQDPVLEGFRLRADGTPVFYLSALAADQDASSSEHHLFIWEDGVYTQWNPLLFDGPPLVPAEETTPLDPPLWCQWYFADGEPEGSFSDPAAASRDPLILQYLQAQYPTVPRWYFQGQEPGAPELDDQRIDAVTCLGEARTYETTGVLYRLSLSRYYSDSSDAPDAFTWHPCPDLYLILSRGYDGTTFDDVRAEFSVYPENMSAEDIILQMTYSLSDLEVSLWRDGYPSPAGPGMTGFSFFGTASFVSAEVLDGWEPVYHDGDYWFRDNYEDFTALRYHSAAEDKDYIYAIDTTRTDLATYRGIRVGNSRAEVLAAYPDLFDTPYWNDPEGDYLWYCNNEEGWGAAVLFFFRDNTVSRIVLNNMFD